jgi:hypothetical protein
MPATAKLTIGSLDVTSLEVRAQYNPKELQLDKQIPWDTSKRRDQQSDKSRTAAAQDDAEFNSGTSRIMTVELLFDGYEQKRCVQPEIDILEELSSVRDPGATHDELRRPHHCVVAWGAAGIRPFRCVIESLSTRITMFDNDGTPLRAVCTVKLKEVVYLSKQSTDNFQQLRMERGWKAP